eukprot:361775-Rhodomonas_salina.3
MVGAANEKGGRRGAQTDLDQLPVPEANCNTNKRVSVSSESFPWGCFPFHSGGWTFVLLEKAADACERLRLVREGVAGVLRPLRLLPHHLARLAEARCDGQQPRPEPIVCHCHGQRAALIDMARGIDAGTGAGKGADLRSSLDMLSMSSSSIGLSSLEFFCENADLNQLEPTILDSGATSRT